MHIKAAIYATALQEAREEIKELCPDIESFEDFVSAGPEKYKDFEKQATDEVRCLYTNGKLPDVYHK